jgi:hypothetical protein
MADSPIRQKGVPWPSDTDMFVVAFCGYITLSQDAYNGRISDKPRRLPRHQRAQAPNSTHYRQQLSFMYWLCTKQNCLMCLYECDFGDNDIITIVKTGLTKKNM